MMLRKEKRFHVNMYILDSHAFVLLNVEQLDPDFIGLSLIDLVGKKKNLIFLNCPKEIKCQIAAVL